jgi:Gas vesicle synthesis protein GvpL/GvpF
VTQEALPQLAEITDLPEDMGLYVYGVVRADESLPDGLAGVDEAPVQLVTLGGVAAAVGLITLDRPPGLRTDLVAHTAVLDALAARGPVVPVQFGSVLTEVDAVVHDFLVPEADRFADLLSQLAGRRQFNVRGRYNEDAVLAEVVAEDAEIASLRERTRGLPEHVGQAERVRLGELVSHALERKREQDAATVLDIVLPHVASYAPRRGAGLDHMMDVAFLVDDDRRAGFEDALEAVAEAMHERVRLQLMGPMAPYDFVEG